MPRFVKLVVVAVAAVLAGCSSTPSSTTDPYALLRTAINTPWERVQMEFGAKVTAGGQTISIDPDAIRLILDTKAGKGSFHLALPASALGADAASLALLGIDSGSIDLDVLYDGEALYAKSPLAATLLPALLAQSGSIPSGDLTGWLKLGTKSEMEALAAGAGASAAPSATNLGNLDTAVLKTELESSGLTFSYAGTTAHNGADANHLTVAVDVSKLSNSSAFDSLSRTQLQQMQDLAKSATLTGDVWLDKGSGRLSEVDVHGVATGSDAGTFDLSMTFAEPDATTSFDPPASSVELPLSSLMGSLFQMIGQNAFGPTP